MEQHPATSGHPGHTDSGLSDETLTTREVVLSVPVPFLSGEHATDPLDGALSYDPSDPYAVSMTLAARAGQVTWTFARELLAEGLYRPTGDGDVQVWPCLSNTGEAVVIVELSSPDGTALLQTGSRVVQRFVAASYDAVPAGCEGAHLPLDDLVAQLLAR